MKLQALSSLALLVTLSAGAQAQILYADANLNTGANDGSSWADAFQGKAAIRKAVNAAVAGDRIFVAQGTYKPALGNDRTKTILLKTGIEIYGGFLGGETDIDERPPLGAAPSILSGDLADDDGANQFSDNSIHLMKAGTSDATTIVDGLVLTGGNADGGAAGNNDRGPAVLIVNGTGPSFRSCHFIANQCTFGGGACYVNGTAPSFVDCVFEDNDGGAFGGAFDIANAGAVRFDRCRFLNNRAARGGALEIFSSTGVEVCNSHFEGNVATGGTGGGGLWIGTGGSTSVVNCTVVANQATSTASGGMRVQGAAVTVASSILWDNFGANGDQDSINQIDGAATVTYSIVEGGFAGTDNLSADPLFTDAASGDYTLTLASPAVDSGDNTALPAEATHDAAFAPRFNDEPSVVDGGVGAAPIVDRGAFERGIGIGDRYCEPLPNSTGELALFTATGSLSVAANDVDLAVGQLPTNQFAYFLTSQGADSVAVASGTLCLAAPQLRFSADVLNSMGTGSVTFSPDLTNLPQGAQVQPGETWYFQLWFRDGATSNFSSSLCFTWE